MSKYLNLGGDSNIDMFEFRNAYIDVKFCNSNRVYRYSYSSAGYENVEYMKKLAISGSGLNSFIMRHVKFKYEQVYIMN